MEMIKTTTAAGFTAAALALAASADGSMILAGTSHAPAFANSATAKTDSGVATAVAQRFTLAMDATIESINVLGFSSGADVNVFITQVLGPESTMADIMSSTMSIATEATAGFGGSFQMIDINDVELSAGDYQVVMTSTDATGFQWLRVSSEGATGIGAAGAATYPADENFVGQSFTTLTGSNQDALGIEIIGFGDVIPSPGAAALLGVAGLAGLRRRR